MEREEWEGEERRQIKRRYTVDRRTLEKRKKYLSSVLIPTFIGLLGAGIISWGAYVTHTTYGISAKYEETFISHIENQNTTDIINDRKFESIQKDYNGKILQLHIDMNDGFKEMRSTQRDIYDFLIKQDNNR
jgi:hypothetical protein